MHKRPDLGRIADGKIGNNQPSYADTSTSYAAHNRFKAHSGFVDGSPFKNVSRSPAKINLRRPRFFAGSSPVIIASYIIERERPVISATSATLNAKAGSLLPLGVSAEE